MAGSRLGVGDIVTDHILDQMMTLEGGKITDSAAVNYALSVCFVSTEDFIASVDYVYF